MKEIRSQIIPLPYSDVNTDLIYPARFLTTTTKHGLGKHLFVDMREKDPEFPLNLKKYQHGKILVTRRNFGCGSSREHAAWAMVDHGIRACIAPSFSDIFYSNAVKNHLLPIVLEAEIIEHIFAAEKQAEEYILDVDLEKQLVTLPDETSYSFSINGYDKHALIHEIDNLDFLLSKMPQIQEFDKRHGRNIFLDVEAIHQ
jgi:3-isopropylmalate/(R)-2-methylmalate dehydratase small subunit